jgi:imidazolonepropionase-like amidohydrolase
MRTEDTDVSVLVPSPHMKRPLVAVAAAVLLSLASIGAQAPAPSTVTAIRAGRLIDTDAGTSAANQIILVTGGLITAVGSTVAIPPGATVVDLSKATVLPGLFDVHTHLCMSVKPDRDHGNYYFTTLLDPDSRRAVEGVANARAMLEAGFTSVRDVGNEGNYACVSVKSGIDDGLVPGPTMQTAGRIIAAFGGQFHLQPDKPALATPEYAFADTRDEMRKAIRENIHFGATVIKIVVDDQRYIYSADDIAFIKAEVHAAGLKLAAHAWTQPGAHNAAEAGVDSIEHGPEMTNDDLALAKKNGVVLVGTDYLALEMGGPWVDRLKRAHQLGVTMAYGTDTIEVKPAQTRGTESMRGIDVWAQAGVPPAALLKAMTSNAARLMGIDRRRGAIKAGQAADIIATAENPLDNAAALKKVVFVMKNGRTIKN